MFCPPKNIFYVSWRLKSKMKVQKSFVTVILLNTCLLLTYKLQGRQRLFFSSQYNYFPFCHTHALSLVHLQFNQGCCLRKIKRSPKVPSHEVLDAQHLSLCEKIKFSSCPKAKVSHLRHLGTSREQPWNIYHAMHVTLNWLLSRSASFLIEESKNKKSC